jgi:HAD superfamily hydrolase (TIGR01509 family)
VIFDMDGVLIDSEPVYRELEKRLFAQLHAPVNEQEHASFVGTTAVAMWSAVKSSFQLPQTVDELVALEETEYLRFVASSADLHPVPGIPKLLAELAYAKVKTGLSSSSSREIVLTVLRRCGWMHYFSAITSGSDVSQGKPAPDTYLRTARLLGVDPFQCMAIEDSSNGVRAAKAAGMTCLGFKPPTSTQELHEADWIVSDLREVDVESLRHRMNWHARESALIPIEPKD